MNDIDKNKKAIYVLIACGVVLFSLFIGIRMHLDYKAAVQKRLLPGYEELSLEERKGFANLEKEVNIILLSKMSIEDMTRFVRLSAKGTRMNAEEAREVSKLIQDAMQKLNDEEKAKVQRYIDITTRLRQ